MYSSVAADMSIKSSLLIMLFQIFYSVIDFLSAYSIKYWKKYVKVSHYDYGLVCFSI